MLYCEQKASRKFAYVGCVLVVMPMSAVSAGRKFSPHFRPWFKPVALAGLFHKVVKHTVLTIPKNG